MGFILLIIAIVASIILFPIGWFYSLLIFDLSFRRLSIYAKKIAISIDQLGNVVMGNLFNATLIKKNGYKFGQEDETVSSCLGKNKKAGTLTNFGLFWAKFLNNLEKDHVEKSIEEDEKSE